MPSALEAFSLSAPGVEALQATQLTFSIPLKDNDELTVSVKKANRRHELNITLRLLERVHSMRTWGDFVESVNNLAAGYRHIRGLSGSTLMRKYYSYRDSAAFVPGGDWRVLVKNYKAPSRQPDDFVEFLKGLIEQNHRSIAAALDKLREEIWPSGASVPGYGTWMEFFARTFPTQSAPKSFPRIYPTGWSVRNLRHYGPTRAEIKIFQRGYAAAHGDLPVLPRDTSNLRPMEWIVIDDFQLDKMSYFAGDTERSIKPQLAYVAGLMAMCVGTRKKLSWLLGPMLEREEKQRDGSVKKVRCNIRAMDVQILLHNIFREHGFPNYTVTILCENATASIKAELELMLSTVFEGRVRIDRTSILHHKTLENGYVEGGGAPWQKGWIESEFNYLWNQMSEGKGYKGSNERLNGPGWFENQKKEVLKLMGVGEKQLPLPPEIIEELRLPFPSIEELEEAFSYVINRSELRTKHHFRGFNDVTEFRWPDPQLPAPAGIDAHGLNSFRALAVLNQEEQRLMVAVPRRECALERWERLSAKNPRTALKASVLGLFLLTPKKATYRKTSVSFTHNKTGYSYIDVAGDVLTNLEEGTELLAYVDFVNPGTCFVTKFDGSPLGTLTMLGGTPRGVDITDPDAMAEAREQRRKVVQRVLEQVRNRPLHKAENEQLGADREHNKGVIVRYETATSELPAGEKLALAVGDAVAQAREQSARKALQSRPVPAQSSGQGLAELSQDACSPLAQAVQADEATLEPDDGAQLSDLC